MSDRQKAKLAEELIGAATGPMNEEGSSYKDIDEARLRGRIARPRKDAFSRNADDPKGKHSSRLPSDG